MTTAPTCRRGPTPGPEPRRGWRSPASPSDMGSARRGAARMTPAKARRDPAPVAAFPSLGSSWAPTADEPRQTYPSTSPCAVGLPRGRQKGRRRDRGRTVPATNRVPRWRAAPPEKRRGRQERRRGTRTTTAAMAMAMATRPDHSVPRMDQRGPPATEKAWMQPPGRGPRGRRRGPWWRRDGARTAQAALATVVGCCSLGAEVWFPRSKQVLAMAPHQHQGNPLAKGPTEWCHRVPR